MKNGIKRNKPARLSVAASAAATLRYVRQPTAGREPMPSPDRIPETVNTEKTKYRNTERTKYRKPDTKAMDPGPTHPKVILPCARVPAFLALGRRRCVGRSNARTRDGAARETCRMPCSPVAHIHQDGPGHSTWLTVLTTA